jgi:uncharacterized membrane protein YphA (DoxX/SURF4 family)
MKSEPPKYFQDAIHSITRLVLAGVFLFAAIWKMRSPQDFADSIASYQIMPDPLVNVWAFGLPLFELICGLFLLTGYFCRIGLLSMMGLLIIFLAAILAAELRGLPINCGCFGSRSRLDENLPLSVSRDMILLLGALWSYRHHLLRDFKSKADDPSHQGPVKTEMSSL